MRTRFPLALLAIIVSSGPLAAQRVVRAGSDSTATVPAELALALATGWPGAADAAEIVVGGLPATFPSDLSPSAGEWVLGGVTFRRGEGPFGRSSIAVIATKASPDSARAAAAARFERGGWRRPPARPDRGGFVASMGSYSSPSMLCRDSLVLATWATPRKGGGTLLRLNLSAANRGEGRSPCDPERDRRTHDHFFEDVPMPSLRAPAGAGGNYSSGSTGGRGTRTATTRLQTTLAPAQVASHYAAQLREAGWTLRPPLADEITAVQSGQFTDDEGRLWHGSLLAMALPGGEAVEVTFRVARRGADY